MKVEIRNPKLQIRNKFEGRRFQTGESQAFLTFSFWKLFRISDFGSRIFKVVCLTLLASTLAPGQETNLLSQTNGAKTATEPGQTNELASAGDLVQTNELSASNDLGVAEEITNTPNRTNATVQIGSTPNSNRDARLRADSQALGQTRARVADNGATSAVERPATDTPLPSRNSPTRPQFSSFRLIAERNIFDPNRFPRRGPATGPAPKTIESFALVGILSYEKGTFAFFDGSSAAYKKALKVADTIAGYKLTDLTPEAVKLAAGTNQVELRVGTYLRREEQGEWTLAKGAETYSASTAATTASTVTPGVAPAGAAATTGAENDVLERLRKKREQE